MSIQQGDLFLFKRELSRALVPIVFMPKKAAASERLGSLVGSLLTSRRKAEASVLSKFHDREHNAATLNWLQSPDNHRIDLFNCRIITRRCQWCEARCEKAKPKRPSSRHLMRSFPSAPLPLHSTVKMSQLPLGSITNTMGIIQHFQ